MSRKTPWRRRFGGGLIVLGLVMAAKALVSGAHAFALGWNAVVAMSVAGLACVG